MVDTVPPVIAPAGITLTDLEGRPLTERVRRRLVVSGPVRIVVEAYDRMDDSPPRRRLGVYRLGYQVLSTDGTPTLEFVQPHIAITFDRLPPAPMPRRRCTRPAAESRSTERGRRAIATW